MNMKLKYLLPAAMLATAFSASAVPAYPGLLERTFEDGSTVMVRLHGDEYFHYMTDEQGFLLVNNGKNVAYQLKDGVRVMADDATLEKMFSEREATEQAQMLKAAAMQRTAALDKNGRTTFPTLGDVHFIVLLVQYDDVKFTSPTIREDMDAMLNQQGYSKNDCVGSVRDYYIHNSDGQFKPTFDISEVITLPHTSSYYVGNGKYDKIQEMVATAVSLADPKVDFSKYCYGEPGVCDAVIIWYAGYGQADTLDPTCIWPHQSSIYYNNVYADDTRIGVYCCFNELNGGSHYRNGDGAMAGMGTPIHEFGHAMGFPDLYDPNYKVKSTPCSWSVFDQGPYLGDGYCPPVFSAYERYLMKWLDFEEVEEGTKYTLKDLNDENRALRIPVLNSKGAAFQNEYFVLESRKRTAGWDAYLPGSGMLIWHIDYDNNKWMTNSVNTVESRKRCHIVTADGSANYNIGKTNATSARAAWPQDMNYITPDTEITLNSNYVFAASNTGSSFITDIKYDTETGVVSFDYNMIKETPNEVTVLNQPVRGMGFNDIPNNELTFTWDAVEGATDYQLTLFRKSGTNVFYEAGLNERSVGKVTSYTLPSLDRKKLDFEYTAYVRVVKGVPSSEKSNEVVFVPSECKVSSVAGVATDNVKILGLKGAIQAPADAEIYNMQGVRCDREGLTPGIYVVRVAGNVTKVNVK